MHQLVMTVNDYEHIYQPGSCPEYAGCLLWTGNSSGMRGAKGDEEKDDGSTKHTHQHGTLPSSSGINQNESNTIRS